MTIASFQLQLYLLFFTMDVSKNFVANNFFPFAQKVLGKGQVPPPPHPSPKVFPDFYKNKFLERLGIRDIYYKTYNDKG